MVSLTEQYCKLFSVIEDGKILTVFSKNRGKREIMAKTHTWLIQARNPESQMKDFLWHSQTKDWL